MKDETKLARFVEQNPNAELHGFFDVTRNGDRRVVILARCGGASGRNSEAAEFVASSARVLVSKAWKAGYQIGDEIEVESLCVTAPDKVKARRKAGAAA